MVTILKIEKLQSNDDTKNGLLNTPAVSSILDL